MKAWYQSKTIWLNIIVLISAIIDTLTTSGRIPSGIVVILSAINVVLRFLSKDAVTVR